MIYGITLYIFAAIVVTAVVLRWAAHYDPPVDALDRALAGTVAVCVGALWPLVIIIRIAVHLATIVGRVIYRDKDSEEGRWWESE